MMVIKDLLYRFNEIQNVVEHFLSQISGCWIAYVIRNNKKVTIQYNIIHYNTIQYITIQYNTIQYNTIQYNTIQYNTILYNTIQYNTTQYYTIQYSTIQYNTIQYNKIHFYLLQNIFILFHILFSLSLLLIFLLVYQ